MKSAESDKHTETGETDTNKGVQQGSSKTKKYDRAFDVFW